MDKWKLTCYLLHSKDQQNQTSKTEWPFLSFPSEAAKKCFLFFHKISFPSITYDKNFRSSTSYPMKTDVLKIVVFHKYICLRGASSSRSRSSVTTHHHPPPTPTPTPTPTPAVFWIRYEGDRLLLRQFNIFDLCRTIKHGEGRGWHGERFLWVSLSGCVKYYLWYYNNMKFVPATQILEGCWNLICTWHILIVTKLSKKKGEKLIQNPC